jgi:nicotinamidase/pyrazinamidase
MSVNPLIGSRDVLLVVDLQNDFCPGGRLAVPNGHEVLPIINRVAERFEHVVLTQDWHPPSHQSFASSHRGRKPYETIVVAYGPQILWPDHCVQGTAGAELHGDLTIAHAQLVLAKGTTVTSIPIRHFTRTIARPVPDWPGTCGSAA